MDVISKQIARRIGYGVILWGILYAAAVPLLPLQASDMQAFKAIMAMLGVLIGAVFSVAYFLPITDNYLREGIATAITWVVTNWVLDLAALLPFTHQTIPQYFMEIGIEYFGMFGILVAIGYLLEKKTASR